MDSPIVCLKCKTVYPHYRRYFHKNFSTDSGYDLFCKLCMVLVPPELQSKDKGSKRVKHSLKQPPNRDKINKRMTPYWKEYSHKNRDKIRLIRATRRAKKRGVLDDFTEDDWGVCLDYWGRMCVVCGSKNNIHADHWYPLSEGGPTTKTNIIPLCKSCNSSKSNWIPAEWLTRYHPDIKDRILSQVYEYFSQLTLDE